MTAIKTDGNQEALPRDDELMSGEELRRRLEHIDVMLHEITQFITEHRPALDRATALLDPAVKLRIALGRKKPS